MNHGAGRGAGGSTVIDRGSQSHLQARREGHLRGGAICRFASPIVRLMSTPMPSKTPNRIPHATADPKAAFGPPESQLASVLHTFCETTHSVEPNNHQS